MGNEKRRKWLLLTWTKRRKLNGSLNTRQLFFLFGVLILEAGRRKLSVGEFLSCRDVQTTIASLVGFPCGGASELKTLMMMIQDQMDRAVVEITDKMAEWIKGMSPTTWWGRPNQNQQRKLLAVRAISKTLALRDLIGMRQEFWTLILFPEQAGSSNSHLIFQFNAQAIYPTRQQHRRLIGSVLLRCE